MPQSATSIAPPRACAIRRVSYFLIVASLGVTAMPSTAVAAMANAPPKIWGAPPSTAARDVLYTFTPRAADADGDRLTFSIVNKPKWMWFSPSTGQLRGVPHWAQRERTFSNIVIRVSDGKAATSLPAFSITVGRQTANAAPKISGTPARTAAIGTDYYFKPAAFDANHDALRFAIIGKPAWASFSTSTGALHGKPTWRNAGTYSGIRISVSDGKLASNLPPFSITVHSSNTNHAPVISGRPVTSAHVGRPYAFRPTASDADGDALTFSIAGRPSWAKFDAATGTLFGTPAAGDVGAYRGIQIKVSDGAATSALATFGIDVGSAATRSVTLNWSAPKANTDGSALTDLAGYRVFYGTASRQYSNSVRVSGAGSTSAVIEGLAVGTWYFAIKSINLAGVTSDYSGEVRATL